MATSIRYSTVIMHCTDLSLTLTTALHEDGSVLSAISAFRDHNDFFICLHSTVGDDLCPYWNERSEKPMTKDFQFTNLNLICRFGMPGSTGSLPVYCGVELSCIFT